MVPIAGPMLAKSLRNVGFGNGELVYEEGCGDGVMVGGDYEYGNIDISDYGEGIGIGGKMMRGKKKGAMKKRMAM